MLRAGSKGWRYDRLMTDEGFLLSPHNARDYLAEQGFLRGEEEVSVRALGGGVSNIVLLVEWPGTHRSSVGW